MRTAAVIMIVGAHDTRNAAFRLTVPVPVQSGLARILASHRATTTVPALAAAAQQPTPPLLGVG